MLACSDSAEHHILRAATHTQVKKKTHTQTSAHTYVYDISNKNFDVIQYI